ncbi:MAG TPA: hypothetical protein PLI45_03355 [Candidatus Woesebacteria bacterium]|nr:hypothetical protein [Candidatus Woesebacteria bacterium]
MINLIKPVFADEVVDIGGEVSKNNFFGYTCIWNLVSNAVNVVFILSAIIVFVLLVVSGVTWITSGGDKAKLESAQKLITNALIGLAIIAASWAIYTLVLEFLGIDISKICTDNPV